MSIFVVPPCFITTFPFHPPEEILPQKTKVTFEQDLGPPSGVTLERRRRVGIFPSLLSCPELSQDVEVSCGDRLGLQPTGTWWQRGQPDLSGSPGLLRCTSPVELGGLQIEKFVAFSMIPLLSCLPSLGLGITRLGINHIPSA